MKTRQLPRSICTERVNYNNRVDLRVDKYVFGPTRTVLSQSKDIYLSRYIKSISLLCGSVEHAQIEKRLINT